MKSLSFQIPDQIDLNEYDFKMAMAVKLYETGKISIGQAAEIVNISKSSLIDVMKNYGSSILFGYSADDLNNDLENA
jgi:predicted HTH domain antitoxin